MLSVTSITDVAAILRSLEPDLRGLGVRHVSVFGSVARGEAGVNSDVDLALDVDPTRIPDGFAFIGYVDGLKRRLRRAFARDVDIVLLPARRIQLREALQRDAVSVF